MAVPGLSTVQLVRRVRRVVNGTPVRDDRGNAVFDELPPVTIPRCSVQPGAAPVAQGEGADLVNDSITIYGPPDWPGAEGDHVIALGDTWVTRGAPQRWPRPGRGHVIVNAEKVSG